jgi:hypothetical protein
MQEAARAFDCAFAKAGNNKPAKTAMMAITTNSSISVKARRAFWDLKSCKPIAIKQPITPHRKQKPHTPAQPINRVTGLK